MGVLARGTVHRSESLHPCDAGRTSPGTSRRRLDPFFVASEQAEPLIWPDPPTVGEHLFAC